MDALVCAPYDFLMSATQPPVRAWRCCVCRFDRYHRVAVMRKNGSRYETAFFACSNCSVMFLNNVRFDAFSTANPSIETPPIVTPIRRKQPVASSTPAPQRPSASQQSDISNRPIASEWNRKSRWYGQIQPSTIGPPSDSGPVRTVHSSSPSPLPPRRATAGLRVRPLRPLEA
jgi:hypothetical protein